jgi:integrase
VHHDFKVLSIEQYREYVRQADPEYRLFLRTAFYTGARFGELTALTKQDIDENRNEIRINKCWSDHGQILRDGKTKHARRSIPIHKSLCEDLLEYVKYKNRDDLIFSYENRKYSSARCHNQIIKKPKAFILRKYNINFRFHDIRHTYASWLLNSSIPIFSVSRWMGHASAAFTMDIYGHMIPENRHDIDTLFDKLTVE